MKVIIMSVKIFPDIKVDISRPSKKPALSYIIDSGANNPAFYIVSTMMAAVEANNKIVGATIDEYFSKAVEYSHELSIGNFPFNERDFLDAMIKPLAEQELIYAVISKKGSTDAVDTVLTKYKCIGDFLKGRHLQSEDFPYDIDNVARAIFVPSPILTDFAWRFSYKPRELEKMVESQDFYGQKPKSV